MKPSPNKQIKWKLLTWLMLSAAMLASSLPAAATSMPSDEFMRGYLAAVLDRELKWPRGSYQLDVRNGVATITLPEADSLRASEARDQLGVVEGLLGLSILTATTPAEEPGPDSIRTRIYDALDILPEALALPANDLFSPLIADPKEPRFFMSARTYHTSVDTVNIAAVGFGESFGIYRRPGKRPGDGLQVGISGGLLAQFNLDAPSFDLINADYMLGLPITYRRGPLSARLRLYHQSSHLGDEFLLNVKPVRVNLSYEAIDALISYDWGDWRGYAGGEYLIHREPASLRPASLHGGIEYRGPTEVWGLGRLIGGLDLKSHDEHNWAVDMSLSAGLEFGDPVPGRRKMRLLLDAYYGHSPHGQFYGERVSYYGAGLGFDF